MAHEAPTPAEFKARFPAFASVDDAIVQAGLTEGGRSVDGTWTAGDYTLAIMLAGAHVLTLDGHGAGAAAQIAAQGLGGFTSFASGPLSVSRTNEAANATGWATTSYGARFLELLRRNVGGPVVARVAP